jgi:sec-independent protein translocase protein TatB
MPFDIGFIELCILLVVGLMVLGPDKLPVAARQLSKWFRGTRRHIHSFTSEINRELEMDELSRELNAQKQALSMQDNPKIDLSPDVNSELNYELNSVQVAASEVKEKPDKAIN